MLETGRESKKQQFLPLPLNSHTSSGSPSRSQHLVSISLTGRMGDSVLCLWVAGALSSHAWRRLGRFIFKYPLWLSQPHLNEMNAGWKPCSTGNWDPGLSGVEEHPPIYNKSIFLLVSSCLPAQSWWWCCRIKVYLGGENSNKQSLNGQHRVGFWAQIPRSTLVQKMA